jgi:hypothetical protein
MASMHSYLSVYKYKIQVGLVLSLSASVILYHLSTGFRHLPAVSIIWGLLILLLKEEGSNSYSTGIDEDGI